MTDGRKYCRMLPLEHSAILQTCINWSWKPIFGLFESGCFTQVYCIFLKTKHFLCWCFMSQWTNFLSCWDVPVLLGWTSTKQRIKCLAQGHNTVPLVMLELATPWSKVLSHCAPWQLKIVSFVNCSKQFRPQWNVHSLPRYAWSIWHAKKEMITANTVRLPNLSNIHPLAVIVSFVCKV